MRTINPTIRDLRRMSRYTILQSIYEAKSVSRLELSKICGLSTGTVTNVVTELLAEGIVLEAGFEASEGGRRRTILTLNRDHGYFIGAEIGESEIDIELFDLALEKLHAVKYYPTSQEDSPEGAVRFIVDGVINLLIEAQVPPEKILGMGLALPGIVEIRQELVFAPSWGWKPVPLKALLEQHFRFPLYLENGAKTMALSEMKRLPATPWDSIVVANLGTGVGAGIIYEGKLYQSVTNSAGEWGHTIVEINGKQCRCGHKGCLEAYVGAPGIIDRLRELAPESEIVHYSNDILIIEALARAIEQGDSVALQTLRDTAQYLSVGLANLVNLFNPQSVVLCGWVSVTLGQYLLPEIIRTISNYALQQPLEAVQIKVGQLGNDVGCIGAAILALEDFFTNVGRSGSSAIPSEAFN